MRSCPRIKSVIAPFPTCGQSTLHKSRLHEIVNNHASIFACNTLVTSNDNTSHLCPVYHKMSDTMTALTSGPLCLQTLEAKPFQSLDLLSGHSPLWFRNCLSWFMPVSRDGKAWPEDIIARVIGLYLPRRTNDRLCILYTSARDAVVSSSVHREMGVPSSDGH